MALSRRFASLGFLVVMGWLSLPAWLGGAIPAFAAGPVYRLRGPELLAPNQPALVWIEQQQRGSWRPVDPDAVKVSVGGQASLVEDPAAVPMNPFTLMPGTRGKAVVSAAIAGQKLTRTLPIEKPEPRATVRIDVDPNATTHRFDGFGGGVLFYDNQWQLSRGDEIWNWCFRDVRTNFLHLLIRPNYEPENDNDDWRTLNRERIDFRKSARAIGVAKKALAINPKLKIYVSLYSPPGWMKTNESTRGDGSLKRGLAYRQELAEYVFAYLKQLEASGVEVDYLALFNEPDWPHEQDGLHMPDLGQLADTFDQTAAALEELIAVDGGLPMPKLVFPDALGAGAITRSKRNTPKLLAREEMLARRADVWGVHDYWNQGGYWPRRFAELREFPPVGDKPIWMTEWAQRYRRGDLESANEYGTNILNALRLGAQAWMVFEWCHPSKNQSGLISCDWGAQPPRERYWRSKAYYVFQQLANNTPAGSQIIKARATAPKGFFRRNASGSQTVEHLAVVDGTTLVLHAYNRGSEPVQLETNWQGNTPGELTALLTGPTQNSQPSKGFTLTAEAGRGRISGVLPANSLVTLRVQAAVDRRDDSN